ncbi:MAG: cache domain-containing protein [Pseudomonadota bacterium]
MPIPSRSFSRTLVLYMSLLVALSTGLLGVLWIFQEYSRFTRQANEMRVAMLAERKNNLIKKVGDVAEFIGFKKSQTEDRVRVNIQSRVHEALALASHIHATYRHTKSEAELKDMVREALRSLRFNRGQGYFFVASLDGTGQLFADDHKSLEGKNLLDVRDACGVPVFRNMITLVREKAEGFYSYSWTKPGQRGKDFKKISFIKYFAPFDWFIGTGVYMDDMESEIKNEVVNWIGQLRFGSQGFVFAGQWDGLILAGPEQGKNMLLKGSADDRRVVKELINLARTGGGYIYYDMPKGDDNQTMGMKTCYVLPVEDWQWYVGAGEYLDDIELSLAEAKKSMFSRMRENIISIVVVLFGLLLTSFLIARWITRQTRGNFAVLNSFFERSAFGLHAIDTEALQFVEFQQMAKAANSMVAERNRVMGELAEKEDRYRSLFESASDAIVILQEGSCVDCNERALRLFGYDREDFIGSPPERFSPEIQPDGSLSHEKAIAKMKLAVTGQQQFFEWMCKKNDGSFFEAEVSLSVLRLAESTYVQAIVRDITARKQAEKQLVRLASAIEQAAEEIVITDNNGNIDYVNPAFAKITGYSLEDVTGKSYAFLAGKGGDPVFEEMWETIREGEVWRGRLSNRKKDERIFEADSAVSPIIDLRGQRMGYVFVMRDVTEQIKVETMFRQTQKMEAIGTLAGGIAHDFNNILAAIFGFAEIAKIDVQPDSRAGKSLEKILEAAGRARDLVKQILTFSRRTDLKPQSIHLKIIAKETIKLLKASLPSTIEIQANFQSDEKVMADPSSIHQIIMNLCANAGHAMGKNGGILSITLIDVDLDQDFARIHSGIAPGRFVRLTISDTGHGMSSEVIDRMFEPFFTTKDEGEGTGMGLAVVHGIVQRLGGAITVHSEIGKGSSFSVYLPIHSGKTEEKKQEEGRVPEGSERILFVDDEAFIVDIAQQMLTLLGYKVIAKTSSQEALSYFEAHAEEIDLLITDYTMPNMTGIDLAAKVRAIRPDLPILLCTGYNAGLSIEEIQAAGIRELVYKPVVRKELAVIVRRALDAIDGGQIIYG